MISYLKDLKRCILLCAAIIVVASSNLRAQSSTLDSLKDLIASPPKDTSDVKNMVALSMAMFYETTFDSALSIAIQARKLAEKLQYEKGVGLALLSTGYVYKLQGSYDAALKDLSEALVIFENSKDDLNIGKSHSFLAQVYQSLGQQEAALNHLFAARKYVERLGHQAGLSVIYLDIGRYYSEKANYELALEYYLLSLKASDSIKAYAKMAMALNNIAVVYERTGELEKAYEYFLQGYSLTKKGNVTSKQTLLLSNLGGICIKLNRFEQAENYLKQAVDMSRTNGDKEYESTALRTLGTLYVKRKNEAKAIHHLNSALAVAREINNPDAVMSVLFDLSEYALAFNKAEIASSYAASALELAAQLKANGFVKDIYQLNAKIDSARGDFKSAFTWHKRYSRINDSLTNASKSANVAYYQQLLEDLKKNNVKSQPTFQEESFANAPRYWFAILSLLLIATTGLLVYLSLKLKEKSRAFTELSERVKA